jgi:hypothetical protein
VTNNRGLASAEAERVRRARRGRRSEPRVWIRTAAQREEQRRLRAHADELGEETRRLRAQLHEATAAKAELQAALPCNMLCGARSMHRSRRTAWRMATYRNSLQAAPSSLHGLCDEERKDRA